MSVDFVHRTGKWRARISVNGRRLSLGSGFKTHAEADAVYAAALAEHGPERKRKPRPFADPRERFFAKTAPGDGGCIIWTGAIDKDGYGKFQINAHKTQRHVRAHRFAFLLKHGRWPQALALHSCDNPRCVNADHLEDGDQGKNVRDCVARGRHRYGSNRANQGAQQ